MRTRGEARREVEAAAAQHAALLALLDGPAHVLEAALAAIGPPGSAAVLAALAHGDHALLREACKQGRWWLDAIPPLLCAYGESHDACAAAVRVLEAVDAETDALWEACDIGHAAAVAALLGAYRRAGRAHEALAAREHVALRLSTRHPDVLALLLAEYGEPGNDGLLAALAVEGHCALHFACYDCCKQSVALLTAAYGPPGCASVRKALVEEDGLVLMEVFSLQCHGANRDRLAAYKATVAALLAALGEPDNATAVREVSVWLTKPTISRYYSGWGTVPPAERLERIPPDSLLARLAVATPAAWAINPDAVRALLSAPVRASLALPALLALRRLPGGVGGPVAAHLRARPWLLFAGAAGAEMEAG
jgi:hypothetical protein